jgi:hypothetical protein
MIRRFYDSPVGASNLNGRFKWYIPLAFLYILLFRIEQGIQFFDRREVIYVAIFMLFSALILIRLLNALPIRNRSSAGIGMVIFLLPAMLFTSWISFLSKLDLVDSINWNKQAFLWLLLFVFLFLFLLNRFSNGHAKLEKYLIVLFCSLCLYQSILIFSHAPKLGKAVSSSKILMDSKNPLFMKVDTAGISDVYFIVFDAYEGNASLNQDFGFNNGWVTKSLSDLGYKVSDHARSAYHYTQYCISSVLNMDYEFDWSAYSVGDYVNMSLVLQHIWSNRMCRIMEQNGYAIRNLSFFDLKQEQRSRSFKPFTASRSFYRLILENSILLRFFINPVDRHQGESNLETYRSLLRVIKEDTTRKFVYAHFMLPHPAFYFDSSGGYYPDGKGKFPDAGRNYIEQVKLSNKWMVDIARNIQAFRPGSMVVMQGDHGPILRLAGDKVLTGIENPFSAIFVPGGTPEEINDSLFTPNTFRFLLKKMAIGPNLIPLKAESGKLLKPDSILREKSKEDP